jgi:CubicO group peptidase (beta-lactamase class C family)
MSREEQELDARERLAVDAWIAEGDELSCVAPGFVDRVMAAEEAGGPGLFAVEDVVAPAAPPSRVGLGRAGRRMLTALLGASGFAALVALALHGTDPLEEDSDEPAVGVAESWASYVEPDELGRPGLRADGTPGAPIPEDLAEQIEEYIADYGRDWGPAFKFHGSILVARDGEVKFAKGFGLADPATGKPNEPTTRYRLGLLTEQFTAVAILQLRDQGILELDDPISRFFPNYPRGSEITLEQLLTHTSGIPNYTSLAGFHGWKDQRHSTDELIARFSHLPLEFDPGTGFSPSNSGYYLLGGIIERVSGSSYGDYLAEHVFAPAGMTSSTFGDAYASGEQARGHVWNDEEILDPPDPIDMSVFGGAGGLVSTPMDLVAWDKALVDRTLVDPDSVKELLTPNEQGYGYGWVVSRGYGQRVVSFPGAIDGFNGSVMRFTEDRTLIVVLCNTEVVPGGRVAQDVAMMVYGDTPPRRVEQHEVRIAPSTYDRYIGAYGLTDQTRERYASVLDPERFAMLERVYVQQLGDRLYFQVPGHAYTWMHPMGRGRFFFKDHSGTRVGFQMGDDDRAATMSVLYKDAEFVLWRLD